MDRLAAKACNGYIRFRLQIEFGGSFDNKAPFDVPAKFSTKRLDNLATPLDFICTADILGGNSGSPVINRNRELVGLIFDVNIESPANIFAYNETTSRALPYIRPPSS